jgi:hypothetical protein
LFAVRLWWKGQHLRFASRSLAHFIMRASI